MRYFRDGSSETLDNLPQKPTKHVIESTKLKIGYGALQLPANATLRTIIFGKGHARAQIIACIASWGTKDKLDQFEITRKRDRITLIKIYVFKSANLAVLGLFWHHPDYSLW